jgi:acyl-CoA dehydrogenase
MTPTDFTPEDRTALLDTVQRFATQAIAPHVGAWDEAGEFPRGLYHQAAELGLLGLGYPEHLGGTPAPWSVRNAMSQTLARHGGSGGVMASLFTHNIGLPPVLAHGTPELQAEVIPPVLRTGPHSKGASGISMIAVPCQTSGISRSKLHKTGWHCSDTAHLRFDGVRVPARYRLGAKGAGFRRIMGNFSGERLAMSAMALGFAQAWVAHVCLLKNHATQTMQHCAAAEEIMKEMAAKQWSL